MLAHKASHEGVQAVETIAGLTPHPLDASFIPNCTYCQPQVASIGRTEAQAREAGYEVKVSKFPFVGIGKAVAIGETEGWVKIVSDARYGEILGATIVGPEATEIIHELVLARTAELAAEGAAWCTYRRCRRPSTKRRSGGRPGAASGADSCRHYSAPEEEHEPTSPPT
jgi:dihydrolipoamide dehydrogenase